MIREGLHHRPPRRRVRRARSRCGLVVVMPALLTGTPRINELALDWRALRFAGAHQPAGRHAYSAWCRRSLARAPGSIGVIAAGSRGVAGGRHRLPAGARRRTGRFERPARRLCDASAAELLQPDAGRDRLRCLERVTFHVGGAMGRGSRTASASLQKQLSRRLEQLPHVQAAGMTNFLPAAGATLRYQVRVDGLTGPNADGSMTVGVRMISGGYLRAIRAPLVAGTWCPAADDGLQGPALGDGEPALRRRVRAEPEPGRRVAASRRKSAAPAHDRRRHRQRSRRMATARVPCAVRLRLQLAQAGGPIPNTSRGRPTPAPLPPISAGSCGSSIRPRAIFGMRPLQRCARRRPRPAAARRGDARHLSRAPP